MEGTVEEGFVSELESPRLEPPRPSEPKSPRLEPPRPSEPEPESESELSADEASAPRQFVPTPTPPLRGIWNVKPEPEFVPDNYVYWECRNINCRTYVQVYDLSKRCPQPFFCSKCEKKQNNTIQ